MIEVDSFPIFITSTFRDSKLIIINNEYNILITISIANGIRTISASFLFAKRRFKDFDFVKSSFVKTNVTPIDNKAVKNGKMSDTFKYNNKLVSK